MLRLKKQEARQQVKELEQEQAKGIVEQKEAETGLQAAQVEDQETAKELISSEKDQEAAAKEEAEAARALKHFGQGQSQSIGAEYYSWNGKNGHGHQLYIPYSYTINMPKVDISLSTGYVISRNARSSSDNVTSNGVTGMTDTTLETVFRNDHKVNDLHYLLSVNLPTGNSIAGGNASLPDNLARFTSFGAGTDLTPGLEAIHHFNDWDSAAVRLTYSHRGGYDNSQSLFGDENNNERVTDTERVHIEPGSLWTQELEYLHAGVMNSSWGWYSIRTEAGLSRLVAALAMSVVMRVITGIWGCSIAKILRPRIPGRRIRSIVTKDLIR